MTTPAINVPTAPEPPIVPVEENRQRSWLVLRNPAYRRYFLGSLCSNSGTWVQNTAQMLLAYRLTGEVWAVGIVSIAQWCGVLVLGPWAGSLADRMDRRELLVVSQLGAAAVAGALAAMYFTGHLTIWYIVAGALLLGLTYTFALPVFSALVPSLVEDHQAKSALMMNTVSYNVGRAVAPVLGIGLVTKIGFTAAFLINSLSFLVLAGFLCTLAPRSPQEPEGRESAKDGFSVAWKNKRILLVLFMVALATVATDPPNVLGPALAQSTFKVPDTWAGVFIAAMGMGNILGSLLRIRKAALRHAALSLCVVGAGMVLFSTGISLWITVAGALLSGIGSLLTGATAQSLIVKYTTPDQRGRVMAVWAIAFAGSRPIASAVDTSIASFASPQIAGVLMAIPALATGCLALPPAIRLGQGFFASGKFTPQSLKPLPDGRVHHLWNQSAKRARKIRADLAASWPQRM